MVNISDPKSKVDCNDYAQYSVNSWYHYCNKHGIDFLTIDENEGGYDFPIWNKEYIHHYGQQYDKIGLVDSDTIIRWDAPNIFDQIEDEGIYGVNDLCDLNWLLDSIKQRQRFFPNQKMNLTKYLNAGILFFGNKHLPLFKKLLDFYLENKDEIHAIKGGGKEQTLLNFFIQKERIPVKVLDPEWNLLSIHRKNMFIGNWQLKVDPLPYFLKYAYVWHFTGFPIEDRVRLMKETWEIIKENYDL
jgi:lipopolysaccharide biosynthesis glycosyltransferase